MKMIDRTQRTNTKKVNHMLRNTSITIFALTCILSIFSLLTIVSVSNANQKMSKSIDNYSLQINLLESDNVNLANEIAQLDNDNH